MSTRFNTTFNGGLHSGYDRKPTTDLSIPPCGIEDVDTALFKLFEQEIKFEVGEDGTLTQVPIIFAAGEKWAMLKRGRALRDKNNSLILPLITILRTGLKQDSTSDITGRGINQQTGELVVKRRLDKTDRGYQNLINKLYLKHQQNVAVSPIEADAGQISTLRNVGELQLDPTIEDGGFLVSDEVHNAYEIITIPAPQYFSATYEVIFWTQYTTHMNQMLEKLMSSYLPQGNAWRLDTEKGYWFVATVDNNDYTPENNFDDQSKDERLIKCSFSVHVPGYILASDTPGAPVPVHRYVSAASVTFQVAGDDSVNSFEAGDAEESDPFLGADDPTLPESIEKIRRRDQRYVGKNRRLAPPLAISPDDPALLSFPRGVKPPNYRTVTYRNNVTGKLFTKKIKEQVINRFSGETSYTSVDNLDALVTAIIEE